MNTTQVFEKRKIAVAIGIDLAKDHCDVVAYNADNKICFTKANWAYPHLMEWLANAQPAVVLMSHAKVAMFAHVTLPISAMTPGSSKGLMSRHCAMFVKRTTFEMRTTLPGSSTSPAPNSSS